jgi:D-glycero-D-manno-heptose 1,7-bisphosphate phosphatase
MSIIKQVFTTPKHKKSIILDRDGTLNFDKGYTFELEKLRIIPEAIKSLKKISQFEWNFFIATNQGGIGLGKFSEENAVEFNSRLVSDLSKEGVEIAAVFSCPHHPNSRSIHMRKCICRKPKTGLYESILRDFNLLESAVWVVGDSKRDMEPATVLGLSHFLITSTAKWQDFLEQIEAT